MLGRSIVKTGVRGGLVTYRMRLMPETSGRLDRIFDSCLSPKTSGAFLTEEQRALAEMTGDSRSAAQQRHDILAAALDAAARSAELPTIGRVFLYMPLMHAESPALQDECVLKFEALVRQSPPELQQKLQGNLKAAREHADIVLRFGRFPHRNAVLGRSSTPEETEFLTHGPRFGQ